MLNHLDFAGMSGGVSGNDDCASAESFSIVDRITHGNFVTTLGMRHEDVEYWEYTAGTHGKSRSVDNSETMFAASTVMNMGDGKSAFFAYSQGYQPTGSNTQEPEESDNYEIGYRSILQIVIWKLLVSMLITIDSMKHVTLQQVVLTQLMAQQKMLVKHM